MRFSFKTPVTFPGVNQIIPVLIMSDFLITTSAALLAPIYALFITNHIPGGTAQQVGFAIAIYWVVKSILQLPIAKYLDKNHGEIDDYYIMLAGMFCSALLLFGYSFASQIWHVYGLQALLGVTEAMQLPPFFAIFTRHIDKGNEGFEWSLRSSVSFGGGSAVGGALGGLLLAAVGFANVFVVASLFYAAGAIVLFLMKPYIIPRSVHPVERMPLEQRKP